MKQFIACVIKDIRLIFSRKTGIAALVLPVILLAVLTFAAGDLFSATSLVRPFKIAVRDEEQSYVSRSLILELKRIELFEDILTVKDDTTDEELFSEGYAAVFTIPDGYFWSMYDMDNDPATIVLNGDMPTESALVRTIFSEVVGIVEAEQKAWKAEYGVRYGDLNDTELRNLWYESANHELERALKRTQVFETVEIAESYLDGKTAFLLSAVLSLLTMFLPLSVLKTVPEERRLGIRARYVSTGHSAFALVLSKAFAGLLLLAASAACPILLLKTQLPVTGYAGILLAYFVSFFLFLIPMELSANASRVQAAGNLVIMASLLIGGIFYPYALLPAWAQSAAEFTVPYQLSCALQGDESALRVLLAMAAVLFILCLCIPKKRRYAQ